MLILDIPKDTALHWLVPWRLLEFNLKQKLNTEIEKIHPAEGEPFIDYSSCYSLLRKGRIESNVSKSNVHGTVTECLNDFS